MLAPFRTRSFCFQWPADLCTAWALEMETLILGWYVLVESGSVLLLTLFGALMYVGTLVSPLLGMWGDRIGLGRMLVAMRTAYALFASVILVLALTGQLQPNLVLLIALGAGLLKPTDIGMRSALVGATLPPSQLVSAMGVSRTTQDSARIGGALAGAGFMAAFGMVPAYGVIVLIYAIGVVLTLGVGARVDAGVDDGAGAARHAPAVVPGTPPAAPTSPWRDLKEGLLYVWRTPRLRAAMCVAALVNLTAFPLSGGLMPYIARDVFHLNQQGLGWLVASFASGALIGSLSMGMFGSRARPARTMVAACALWYLCLLGFALPISVPLAMLLLLGAGLAQSLSMLSLTILLLRTSEQRFRGRIMGVRMLAIYTLPLGLLAAGGLIPAMGFRPTALGLVALGLLLLAGILLAWRDELWPLHAPGNAR